jgi:serine/threonine protein kinase
MRTGDMVNGQYLVQSLIGQGTFGRVWQATDTLSRNTVAVKELKVEWTKDIKIVKRFRNEYRVLNQARHPNIARPLALLSAKGSFAIVMDYLAGGSLADRLRPISWLPIDTALSTTLGLLEALEVTASLGVIHRDIKPANVLFANASFDQPKLSDFGLAHLPDGMLTSSRPTTQPQVMGTLAYMSPEQLNGEEIDIRSDIYAVGMTLYEMLTGRLFFDRHRLGPIEVQSAISRPYRERPSRYRPETPQWLDDLLLNMIAFELYKRPERPSHAIEAIRSNMGL